MNSPSKAQPVASVSSTPVTTFAQFFLRSSPTSGTSTATKIGSSIQTGYPYAPSRTDPNARLMTSHFTPSATILHPEASCADALRMGSDRAHSFYTSAIVGCGMVFILGAFLATDAANTRGLLAGLFFGILSGGIYVLVLLRKTSALSRENTDLRELNSEAGARDDDLRAQLGYTLCEPLAVAAGKADELLSSPSMPYGDQQAILTSIRDNTLEVEQTLKALAAHGSLRTATTPRLSSVVLLDEELRSIGQASPNFDHYDFDIEQARAWGDPALVRQILRTLVNVSTHDDGAPHSSDDAARSIRNRDGVG